MMTKYYTKIASLIISASLFLACAETNKKGEDLKKQSENDLKIIAYVHGWQDNWGANSEKANLITHVNYAFANIKDGKVVEGRDTDAEALAKLNQLKSVNQDLKILISVGGWGWSKNFSDAVLTENSREVFANSAIDFMIRHQIDGIDLDWEYPGQIGDNNVFRKEDNENFTTILRLIRKKLDSMATKDKSYLLTIATGANQSYLDHTNMREAHKSLDFINIMTYDYYTGGSEQTGHHSNLEKSVLNTTDRQRSSRHAVNEHTNAGIPVHKIVLGVPFYGRYWKGTLPENKGLYQSSDGKRGGYSYAAIADSIRTGNFTRYWDSTAMAPYIWRDRDSLFLTYEDTISMNRKIDYVKKENLGGIMFWQFNGDNGELLETIFNNLK